MTKKRDVEDYIGKVYGSREILREDVERSAETNRIYVWTKCACTKLTSVSLYRLIIGDANHCSCINRTNKRKTHCKVCCVELKTRAKKYSNLCVKCAKLYNIFSGMKNRCYNKNSKNYHRYGGRGISIQPSWLNDRYLFILWGIHAGYETGLTIDRINNDGNYESGNLKWSTMEEQSRNKSTTQLNIKQVAVIKYLLSKNRYKIKTIAAHFKCSVNIIYKIHTYRTWSNVAPYKKPKIINK